VTRGAGTGGRGALGWIGRVCGLRLGQRAGAALGLCRGRNGGCAVGLGLVRSLTGLTGNALALLSAPVRYSSGHGKRMFIIKATSFYDTRFLNMLVSKGGPYAFSITSLCVLESV